jgi:hypothetical protein
MELLLADFNYSPEDCHRLTNQSLFNKQIGLHQSDDADIARTSEQ